MIEYRERKRVGRREQTRPGVTTQSLRTALWTLVTCAMVLALLVPTTMRAQVGTADVLGTVSDPSGAVIANAKVTVKNLDTSVARTTTTNAKGEYIFTTLPNGRYSLTVEAQGFKTYDIVGLPLTTGERARYDATLQTGVITEKVEVTGQAAALQTDSSTLTSTVDSKIVQELPLNNRQFVTALQIQPGINAGAQGGSISSANGSPQDRRNVPAVAANGQNSALNNQLIDGFDNNERQQGLIGLQPSIDGIQEVKVDTSTYRAEYGRTAGAVINVVTKSGTNEFHGSAYDYLRNDILDASSYNFFSGTPTIKPKYRQNNFGGSVGGPIIKNKTFFFFDLEEDRIIRGQTATTRVPTAFERANPGNFRDANGPNLNSNTPGYENCTDAAGDSLIGRPILPPPPGLPPGPPFFTSASCDLNPIMLRYFSLFPASQVDQGGVGFRTDSPNITQKGRTWDLRIDHHFNANNSLFARYANNPVNTIIPNPWPTITSGPYAGISPGGSGLGFPGPSSTASQNFQLNFVHIFNPNLLLDLKAGFTRVNIHSYPWNYGIGAADKLDFPGAHVAGMPQTDGLPGFGGPTASWDFLGSANSVPIIDINNTYQYSGSVSWTRGSHTFKFGGGLNRRQLNPSAQDFLSGFFVIVSSPPFFDDKPNFLAGYPIGELRGNQVISPGYRAWEPYGYAQDDWRVTRKLTLNLGLRYDVFTPFIEKHGNYANYIPSTESFILGKQNPSIGVHTDFHDFAPRAGFAYSISPTTVLRGGFGISFFPPDVGMVSAGGGNGPVSVVQNFNPPYAFEYSLFGSLTAGPGGPFTQPITSVVEPTLVDLNTWKSNPNVTLLSTKDPNFSSAYAYLFNLALQKEIGANTLSLGYVGLVGKNLLRTTNAQNPGPPGANNPTLPYVYPDIFAASCNPGPPPPPGEPPPPPGSCVGTINYAHNGSVSNYNAMQAIYSRRLTKGFTLSANYTWSHGLEASGNTVPNDVYADYGNSANDIRHRIAFVGSYELPFAKGSNGIVGQMFKEWQVTSLFYWQSGLPFSVDSRATAPNGLAYINEPGVSTDRPDVVTNAELRNPSLSQWFNVQAFLPQTQGTVSNQAPNQFRGPTDRRFDLAISKTFPITERFKLQFRAEGFNISNTPNFSVGSNTTVPKWAYQTPGDPTTPVVGVDTAGSTFGQITDTAANENPRQFQFALKLLF